MSPHENVETLSTDQEHPPQASPKPDAAPREEYERRLKERRRILAQRQRVEKTISATRLAVMVALIAVAWLNRDG